MIWRKLCFPLVVALLMSGCWLQNLTPPPGWVITPQAAYSTDRYLVGMGEGSTREQAEQRAYAAVARIFSADVQARSLDQESYTRKEIDDRSSTKRMLHIDHLTQVTTDRLLENVKILESWTRKSTGQFFILAGLDRPQTETMLVEQLQDLDASIADSVTQGRTHSQKIHRIQGYKQALALLHQRIRMNRDLRVIRASGEGQPLPYTPHDLQREFIDFVANHLVISVIIKGENHEELERAIWEGLKQEGLLAGAQERDSMMPEAGADILISGTGRLWPVDLPDPLFRYVRWCGDVQIREVESGRLVGVISQSGREGHITEQEARMRAGKVMQEVIAREVARQLTRSVFSGEEDSPNGQSLPAACPS
jgi:hypothetical protein